MNSTYFQHNVQSLVAALMLLATAGGALASPRIDRETVNPTRMIDDVIKSLIVNGPPSPPPTPPKKKG